MSVNNINNSAAQLQLYANEKAIAQQPAQKPQLQTTNSTTTSVTQSDSVQISEQARALQLKDADPIGNVSPLTNGMGIEPPKGN